MKTYTKKQIEDLRVKTWTACLPQTNVTLRAILKENALKRVKKFYPLYNGDIKEISCPCSSASADSLQEIEEGVFVIIDNPILNDE